MSSERDSSTPRRKWAVWAGLLVGGVTCGCGSPPGTTPPVPDPIHQRHVRQYGDAELPRKIGSVETVGLQAPVVSPDGRQILYLRSDAERLDPMTLLGSPDPKHTPPEGMLSIWLRPLDGKPTGRRLSRQRWAHSPVWSSSGAAVAYVANQPPGSVIVCVDLSSDTQTILGLRGAINLLPRFDGDDRTLLFCTGKTSDGPLRVCRQAVGQNEPTILTPEGTDCLLPARSDQHGGVVCAQPAGEHLSWVRCDAGGLTRIATQWGVSSRLAALQTWAGIAEPVSPDRESILFHDLAQNRISVLHVEGQTMRRHRRGSIAACWTDNQTIALATSDGVFVVHATSGVSTSLFNGQWIPCRYVPDSHRLILLGRQTPRRLAIWEVVFRPKPGPT